MAQKQTMLLEHLTQGVQQPQNRVPTPPEAHVADEVPPPLAVNVAPQLHEMSKHQRSPVSEFLKYNLLFSWSLWENGGS